MLNHWKTERREKENLPRFYFGILRTNLQGDAFRVLLTKVEKLLIYVHAPSYNSNYISGEGIDLDDVSDLTIYNWGQYRSLLPELSGKRWKW